MAFFDGLKVVGEEVVISSGLRKCIHCFGLALCEPLRVPWCKSLWLGTRLGNPVVAVECKESRKFLLCIYDGQCSSIVSYRRYKWLMTLKRYQVPGFAIAAEIDVVVFTPCL